MFLAEDVSIQPKCQVWSQKPFAKFYINMAGIAGCIHGTMG